MTLWISERNRSAESGDKVGERRIRKNNTRYGEKNESMKRTTPQGGNSTIPGEQRCPNEQDIVEKRNGGPAELSARGCIGGLGLGTGCARWVIPFRGRGRITGRDSISQAKAGSSFVARGGGGGADKYGCGVRVHKGLG